MKSILAGIILSLLCFTALEAAGRTAGNGGHEILNPDAFLHHVERFNTMEDENVTNWIPNARAWSWMSANVPLFECPDKEVEEIYYYRWWSLRKHIIKTPSGFVMNEFLTRATPVSSALGHQLSELRWVRDPSYLENYALYWLKNKDGKFALHRYSSWLAYAIYQDYLVTHDSRFSLSVLSSLVADYRQWEVERLTGSGLFYQYDVRDAMEESISGSRTNKNLRPSINSYMYGNAVAIAAIAGLAKDQRLQDEFSGKAVRLKSLVLSNLWDDQSEFFKVKLDTGGLSDAREETGFIPWYFNLPGSEYEKAWMQLNDKDGFMAPFGITTAERRHPKFRSHGCCHCEWDGAVWPFATSQTLTAMANVMEDRQQTNISRSDYFRTFMTYVHSQHTRGRPYIGEYMDEVTGQWFDGKGDRSRFYNHSTFADLLITGLVGIRPTENPIVKISPLLPPDVWDWFCLDGVLYHGHMLTIIWDKDGEHYRMGKGLIVMCDGKRIAEKGQLISVNALITEKLPP